MCRFYQKNKIGLTASEDRERSGLRSSSGGVTKQQSNTLASRDGNNPGERGACEIIPGYYGGTGRVVARVNTLHTRGEDESIR